MKTFVIGDIHGGYRALIQCLERSEFDYDKDKLICLGDVADGWSEVPECIEELLKINNLIYILGNHDIWLKNWLETGARAIIWTEQGGEATLDAYITNHGDKINTHRSFIRKGCYKYIDDKNRIFVHGGFSRGIDINVQSWQNLLWDRSLAEKAVSGHGNKHFRIREFDEVYVGHTTVNSFSRKRVPRNLPFNSGNMWLMDTGAGMEGKLSMMNIDTKEIFQSDLVMDLYPEERGRN